MKKATSKNTRIGDIVTNVVSVLPRYEHMIRDLIKPGQVFEVTSIPPKVRMTAGPLNDKEHYFVNLRSLRGGQEVATNFCNIRLLLTEEDRTHLIQTELEERNK